MSQQHPNRVYELPLARDYVRNWGVTQAVRELIQNAIDTSAPFEYVQLEDTLCIISRGSRLDAATLVLGRTSKADDDHTIGQFGEGYKLALLVLAREGKSIEVINDKVMWKPEFRQSRQFGIETMHIVEYPSPPTDRVEFVIKNLTAEEQQAITNTCLFMQPDQDDAIVTSQGRILPSKPGQLYVGGLYVSTTNLNFGYDIKPEHLKLERDRSTVDGWNLQWVASRMWTETGRYDDIAQMLEKDMPDVKMLEWSSPSIIKEACFKLFNERHPGALAVGSQEEMERAIREGTTKTVYVRSSAYHANIKASVGFAQSPASIPKPTPRQNLERWLDDNRAHMGDLAITNFGSLLSRADGWRNV